MEGLTGGRRDVCDREAFLGKLLLGIGAYAFFIEVSAVLIDVMLPVCDGQGKEAASDKEEVGCHDDLDEFFMLVSD